MSEKILIVELPDFIQPRTQADLDSLKAEDVGRLDDACLAAAFARLVAGRLCTRSGASKEWFWSWGNLCTYRNGTYGLNVATVDAIQARGWEWKVWRQWSTCWARVGPWKTVESERCHAVFPDPARALLAASVLAAIAERDGG